MVVFSAVLLVGHLVSNNTKSVLDIDGSGEESATEKRMKKFIGIFLADLTFNISWKLRSKVNRQHLVYSRWFPNIGKATFGVVSYKCSCLIPRMLHLKCVVSMETQHCPMCNTRMTFASTVERSTRRLSLYSEPSSSESFSWDISS